MKRTKNFVIAGIMVFAFIQLREIRELKQEMRDLKEENTRIAALAEANTGLSNRLVKAAQDLEEGKREVARLRSSATQAKRLREENHQLTDQRSRLIEQQQQDRAGRQNQPEKKEIPWMDKRYGPGTSKRTGAARDWGLALKNYAEKNKGRYPRQLADAAPFLKLPEDRLNQALQQAQRFELVFHGTEDDLRQLPSESTIILRERTPLQSENATWTKVYGLADGSGQVIAQPQGAFEYYERLRIPQVVQP